MIDDWLDLTVLEAEKRGPALKNRLVGDAEMYKGLLDREPLRAADGVKYFTDTLRPHFIKAVQSVLLWRFYQFTRARRGNIEMVKWIGNFSLLLKRLRDAWMDMLPLSTMSEERRQNQYLADVTQQNVERQRRSAEVLDPNAPETRDKWYATQVSNHEKLFPFSDNLTTLMFIVVSDLCEAQRERLTSSLSLQGMTVTAYTFEAVGTVFVELFCTPKSSMENPSLHVRGHGSSMNRTFIVEDCAEDDFGQWATDEVTGEQGYIDDERSCFWTWDDKECAWRSRPFKGRQVKRRKGKCKGRSERTGRAFFGDEQAQDPELWSEEDFAWLSKGKKGLSKGNDGCQNSGCRHYQSDKGAGKDYTQNKDKGKDPKGKRQGRSLSSIRTFSL